MRAILSLHFLTKNFYIYIQDFYSSPQLNRIEIFAEELPAVKACIDIFFYALHMYCVHN